MMAEISLAFGFIGFVLSVIVLIVFFVMASNLGTAVKLLRAIHHELKELNNPTVQKAKKFDSDH